MSKINMFSIIAFIAVAILSACNTAGKKADTTQEYKDSVTQAGNVTPDTMATIMKDWSKFKADADAKIRENEDSIAVMKSNVEKKDAKMKVKYRKMVATLEVRNSEMKTKLENYKVEEKDKMETFRADFKNSMDSLDTDIKDFFKGKK